MMSEWRVMKSKNETPCCQQPVRVKIVEPGPQLRKCPLCKAHNWFMLEPSTFTTGALRLRWMSTSEIDAMLAEEQEGIAEGLDVRDL